MKYFVMLRGSERPFAIVEREDEIALYDSREEVEADARQTVMGEAYGFEVYPWEAK